MCLYEIPELLSRTTLGQRTGSIQVGNQYNLVGTKNLIGFAHKVNTAHHYDVRLRLGSLLCQRQTVTYKIRYILDFTIGVIMRHDDGILLFTHTPDLGLNIRTFWNGFVYVAQIFPLIINNHYILLFIFFL